MEGWRVGEHRVVASRSRGERRERREHKERRAGGTQALRDTVMIPACDAKTDQACPRGTVWQLTGRAFRDGIGGKQ